MKFSFITECLIYLIGSFLVSFLINKLLLRFAKSLGIRNKNDVVIRWSNTSKPSLGGISLYFTFMTSVMFYAITSSEDHIFNNIEFIGLISAATVAFVIGVADDAYDTNPLLKLSGQIFCGAIFVFTDNAIDVFHIPILDGLITIIWVVAVMNSLNMLDNMDGITGTVSTFILITCFVVFGFFNDPGNTLWSILIIAEIGALIAFLCYNIHPARMFMGDTGSQFIALFVSFFGIKALWNLPSHFELPSWSAVFIILAAFTPAVADTLSVVINRTKRGVSVMLGGKDHTTHHMVYKGYSEFKVWIVFLVISIISTLIAFGIGYFISLGQLIPSIAGLVLFIVVFILLFRNTIKFKEPKNIE